MLIGSPGVRPYKALKAGAATTVSVRASHSKASAPPSSWARFSRASVAVSADLHPHPLGDVDRDAGEAAALDRVRDMRPHPRPADLAARPADAEDDVALSLPSRAASAIARTRPASVGWTELRMRSAGISPRHSSPQRLRVTSSAEKRSLVRSHDHRPTPPFDNASRSCGSVRGPPAKPSIFSNAVTATFGLETDIRNRFPTSAEVIQNRWLELENRTRTRLPPPQRPVRSSLVPDPGAVNRYRGRHFVAGFARRRDGAKAPADAFLATSKRRA